MAFCVIVIIFSNDSNDGHIYYYFTVYDTRYLTMEKYRFTMHDTEVKWEKLSDMTDVKSPMLDEPRNLNSSVDGFSSSCAIVPRICKKGWLNSYLSQFHVWNPSMQYSFLFYPNRSISPFHGLHVRALCSFISTKNGLDSNVLASLCLKSRKELVSISSEVSQIYFRWHERKVSFHFQVRTKMELRAQGERHASPFTFHLFRISLD